MSLRIELYGIEYLADVDFEREPPNELDGEYFAVLSVELLGYYSQGRFKPFDENITLNVQACTPMEYQELETQVYNIIAESQHG